ncbi:MAG: hypothetical protein MUC79_05115 [Thiobacillaceae bacterium]|jgi:hypothetical protein|nr:hypothetical protein [Thiobacillaceae bacterium]
MLDTFQELVWQLHRLPGGAAAAIPDFFAALLAGPEETDNQGLPYWTLREGGRLRLTGDDAGGFLRLTHDGETIVELPAELLAAARQEAGDPSSPYTVSPLVLALVAIAAGHVDDHRQLKKALPRVDGAAKDLMLMTVCRLCG